MTRLMVRVLPSRTLHSLSTTISVSWVCNIWQLCLFLRIPYTGLDSAVTRPSHCKVFHCFSSSHRGGVNLNLPILSPMLYVPSCGEHCQGLPFFNGLFGVQPGPAIHFGPAYKIGISWQDSNLHFCYYTRSNRCVHIQRVCLLHHKKFFSLRKSAFQPLHSLCAILYRTQPFFKKEFLFDHHSLQLCNKPKSNPVSQYCKMARQTHPSPQTPRYYFLSKVSNCNTPTPAV